MNQVQHAEHPSLVASHRSTHGAGLSLANGMFSLLSSYGRHPKLTVLLFHKIPHAADPLTPAEPLLAHFEQILDFLHEYGTVLPLGDAVQALAKGTLPKKAISITFDDGYDDWLTTVSPALRARNMSATFFITTEQLGGPALWHERIVAAVRELPDAGARLPYGFGNYSDLRSIGNRINLVNALTERMKYAPLPERLGAVEFLEAQSLSALSWPKRFDLHAVRELHNQGFEIGGHTITHPILNECSADQALSEIGGCKEELELIIKAPVHLFAYPNGRPGKDYDASHVAMVKACGYTAAVATSGGGASRSSDIFQLPRFSPWGTTDTRIAFQLARNLLVNERKVLISLAKPAAHNTPVRCLLVASTFAPMHGGSAVVYENLCIHMPPDSIRVLTAKTNYLNNQEIEGWQQHDQSVNFPIDRIRLLRPLMQQPPANFLASLCRFAFQDIPLYAHVLLAAVRIVRQHKINIVCVGELVSGSWIGIALKKIFGLKLMIYIHGEEITTVTGGRLHGNQRRQYLQAADKVIAVSSFTCDALTSSMDLQPDRIVLIQNGVDVERFTPAHKNAELVNRYRLQGKKVVLTLGRLVQRKGADMAIRAMATILKNRPDIHYLIVGDGELKETLQNIIQAEGVSDQVTLVGKVSEPELVEYFRLCDVFLMPNRTLPDGDTEGFGLVFREANACGKPVIGGRAGGVVEAVSDGESGLLVDGTNADEIGHAVLKILDNPALADAMGKKGWALANGSSTKTVASRFLTACERSLRTHHA
jgi:glycosyltransferase involved in cell wall biosynthesis/peptidoglycan/xylan/chitin deacetylase (PgdA/CDA1 family)